MAFWPNSIATPHELRTSVGGGLSMVVMSGYAVFNFKGTGSNWRHEDIYITFGPTWSQLVDVVPIVSLASVSNRNHAVNAGWAVDNCRWATFNGRILLQAQLAVRDIDGYIHRVAYQATAIGRL